MHISAEQEMIFDRAYQAPMSAAELATAARADEWDCHTYLGTRLLREQVLLRYTAGFSDTSIAVTLSMTAGRVYYHLHKAAERYGCRTLRELRSVGRLRVADPPEEELAIGGALLPL
jgi:DNA-directed RNA polymerase specialized sigma24 family protein